MKFVNRDGVVVSRHQGRGHRRRVTAEWLEPRLPLAADLLITEIVADNEQGLADADDDRGDWLEIYNAGDTAADLAGWHLTDDAEALDRWTFPAVRLEPQSYLIVYASGKDRTDPSGELHTSFQLDRDGEYLALVEPDARTIADEYRPAFPALHPDRSFGRTQDVSFQQLIDSTTPLRVLVPSMANGGDQLGTRWTEMDFDDSAWMTGSGGVGFEGSSGYEELIGVDVGDLMFTNTASAFIRIPFAIDNPHAALSMQLRVRYDDGYVAYLNGQEFVRRNAPDELSWEAAATTNHRDSQASVFEVVEVSQFISVLRPGQNVLSVHGMNSTTSSDDFLIDVQLDVELPHALSDDAPRYFQRPTPGRPNGLISYFGLTDAVQISHSRGFYDQSFEIEVSSPTPGSTLVYTVDGSAPSLDNGIQVMPTGPGATPMTKVVVDKTTTFRAAAFKEGHLPSAINTQSYIFLDDVVQQDFQSTIDAGFPESWGRTEPDYGMDSKVIGPDDEFDGQFSRQIMDALKAAPSVSVVLAMEDLFGDDGIYRNSIRSGSEWERPASFEFIMPDGSVSVQADAGLRIQGDNVRQFSNSKKQSFRFEFREEYGPTKLRFPVFGPDADDTLDTLILRGGYNDAWVHTPSTTQYIRDQWARTTLMAMGHPQVHGRFVHVYLNGFYWGMYNMVERPNSSFSASYFDGDKDEWDALNTGLVRDGNRDAWGDLLRLSRDVQNSDQAASNAAFLRLLGRSPDGMPSDTHEVLLDVDNYIDYLIVNFYGGNTDWPGRNYYVGRRRGVDSTGFKFYAWDTEKILDHGEGSNLNTDRTGVNDGVAIPYRYLIANDEFRLLFADHVHRHFFNGGALYVDPQSGEWDPQQPQRNQPAWRYDQIARQAERPLIAESARWGDTQSTSTRNDGRTYTVNEWRSMRDRIFANYFPRRSSIVLDQFIRVGLYPELAAPVFNQHGGTIESGFQLQLNAPGPVYYTLDGTDPRLSPLENGTEQPRVAPTASLYDGPISLEGSLVIKARTLVDGVWSALNEATFHQGAPDLRISELMYHPRGGGPAAGWDDDEYEFIELINTSDTVVADLAGVAFTEGIQLVLAGGQLLPGERGVVVRNRAAFIQRYGEDVPILGEYGNVPSGSRLDNAGETIRLVDALGGVIQQFSYDDQWIESTDGMGYSLTIIDDTQDVASWSDAESWRASWTVDGSPGTADVVDFTGDGRLDINDVDAFCAGYRTADVQFDLDGNRQVDQDDLRTLILDLIGTSFGDADLNGVFDTADLVQLLAANEYDDAIAGNSTWAEGDWNCDGEFDSRDLVFALAGGGFIDSRR